MTLDEGRFVICEKLAHFIGGGGGIKEQRLDSSAGGEEVFKNVLDALTVFCGIGCLTKTEYVASEQLDTGNPCQ